MKIRYTILLYSITFLSLIIAANTCAYTVKSSGTLETPDGINIAYEHYKSGHDSVIIICPGFYNSKESKWMMETVNVFLPYYDVIIFDFRGHGDSTGTFTWSRKEYIDAETIIHHAKRSGYKNIGIVAYSLGAVSAIYAAGFERDIKSMILISCPCKFSAIDFHFWEEGMLSDLKDNINSGWRGKGARVGNPFLNKKDAEDNINNMGGIPVLFIHGDKDWVVAARHSKKLFSIYNGGEKELSIIKGGMHAERLLEKYPAVMDSIMLEWFANTLK